MARFLLKLSDGLDRVVKFAAVPVCVFFVAVVFIGVLSRYVLRAPIVPSVELSRIGFVWSCFLGAAICVKRESHIKFVFLFERMPSDLQRIVQLALSFLMVCFFGFTTVKGIQLLDAVRGTFFPASGASQIWMFAALPTSSLIMLTHSSAFVARDISRLSRRRTDVQMMVVTDNPHLGRGGGQR